MSPVTSAISVPEILRNATGPIEFGFINDYMFRAVMEKNIPVLKGLICSLLHLRPEDLSSVTVINPILEGDSYSSKEFILDIEIVLNNNLLLNLEMQVADEHNWPERSLSYLCRRFDQLGRGVVYIDCKPAIHIGFLDFTPFPECAEFYATYKLLNIKNHHLYSDKFTLSVIDLSHIELATREDKACGLDKWARLFKAKTWEELKMIAKDDLAMTEAAESLCILNADEPARARARARQEAILHEQAMQKRQEDLERAKQEAVLHAQAMQKRQEDLERAKQEAVLHAQAMQKRQEDLERARQEAVLHAQAMQKRQEDLERATQEAILHEQAMQKRQEYLERAKQEAVLHAQAMQKRQETLERQLAERTSQLHGTEEKYRAAMSEIEQLRAELSHYQHA